MNATRPAHISVPRSPGLVPPCGREMSASPSAS